jgi:hypothetical protein
MVKSESDLVGEYELRAASGKIVLRASPDKSFSETIYGTCDQKRIGER